MAELSYNATGAVRTLVGNWQEEQELKGVTGTARCEVCCSRIAHLQAGTAVVMLLSGLLINALVLACSSPMQAPLGATSPAVLW